MRRKVIIFGADMSSSVHVDDKKKDMLNLGEGPTQGLDDTTLTAGAKYSINFTQRNKRPVLSLLYNGITSFLLLMLQRDIDSKQKTQKYYALCLGHISKNFTINNTKK